MDIEEMKRSWAQLNDQLEKSEKVNRDAIRGLIADKAAYRYDKIRSNEKASLFNCIFLAIMLPVMYMQGIITYWYSIILMEVIVIGGIVYTLYLLRRMPKTDGYKNGLVNLIKENTRYQKLYTFSTPIFVAVIVILWIVFMCSIGKGFQNDTYHQVIFYSSIVLVIIAATYGYRKTKRKLDEINRNLDELKKFVDE